jgi:hypothetical protein
MTRLLSLCLLWLPALMPAQVPVLEHEYTTPRLQQRYWIDGFGELYVFGDGTPQRLELYDGQHNFIKNVELSSPSGVMGWSYFSVKHVSRTVFNSDTLLEFWIAGNTTPGPLTDPQFDEAIFNENGDLVLNNGPWNDQIIMVNGASKFILNNKDVYALPGLTLEHSYTDPFGLLMVAHLGGADRYVVTKATQYDSLYIFNDDHTPWQTVPALQGFFGVPDFLSDDYFDDDPGIEALRDFKGPEVFDSDGSLLHLFPGQTERGAYGPSTLSQVGFSGDWIRIWHNDTSLFYDPKTFVLQGAIPGNSGSNAVRNYQVTSSEFAFAQVHYDLATDPVKLYAPADFSLWKNIAPDLPVSGHADLESVTKTAFNSTPDVEIGLNTSAGQYFVVREDGAILYALPTGFNCSLSRLPGLPSKLLCTNNEGKTRVYALPGTSSIMLPLDVAWPASVVPNPATDFAALHFLLRSASRSKFRSMTQWADLSRRRASQPAYTPLRYHLSG